MAQACLAAETDDLRRSGPSRETVSLSERCCAVEALPYENPKLSAVAVASMSGNEFAQRLDRAIARSRPVLIEAKAVEPAPE
jgi:hypothetical protein